MIDTTDPRANYPETDQWVNPGDDERILPGALGRVAALHQRLHSFKSETGFGTRHVEELLGGALFEFAVAYTKDGKPRPYLAFACPYQTGRWATIRFGWHWDSNWGDERIKPGTYNPQPEIVGGFILDVRIKFRSRQPFIERA